MITRERCREILGDKARNLTDDQIDHALNSAYAIAEIAIDIGIKKAKEEAKLNKLKLFTIGFTKKSKEDFLKKLLDAGVKKVLDIRLWNTSPRSGYARKKELQSSLPEANILYEHLLFLAPTKELLGNFKNGKISWQDYEKEFLDLLKNRKVETMISRSLLDHSCLLCAEKEPDQCHRRLAAEYLKDKIGNIEIGHIL